MGQSVYTKLGNHLQNHPNHLNSQALLRFAAAGLASFVLAFIAASVLAPVKTSDAQELTVNNTPVSYTIDVSSAHSAESPIAMEITPGVNNIATTTDTVTTTTNSPAGYNLYISMDNDNENGNTLFLDGTETGKPGLVAIDAPFASPVAISGAAWGYTMDADNVESHLYSGVKLKSSAERIYSSASATSDSGDSQVVYFAASATAGFASGDYSGTVLYTATAESPDTISVSPALLPLAGGQIVIATGFSTADADLGSATVTISNGSYESTCADASASLVNGFVAVSCTAPRRVAGAYTVELTLNKYSRTFTGENILVYEASSGETGTISDLEYMQDMTPEFCDATPAGTTAVLKDRRGRGNAGSAEDDSYGVIKAKDGNCWMTENFDLYNMTGYNAIKAEDSDFASGTFEIPNTSNWSGSDKYTAPLAHRGTSSGFTDQVYYNWCSAVALSTCATTDQQDQSICPKNWQLPIDGNKDTDKTYAKLMNAYGVATGPDLLDENHDSYVLGFHKYYGLWDWYHGSETFQNYEGVFWSSTPSSTGEAYTMLYFTTNLNLQDPYHKAYGFSIRCVSRS